MLVVLSLVIFDAIWVSINRLKKRKSPLKGDYTHLHYRLMSLSWSKTEVRVFVRGWSLFLMILMILQ
jgi:UDP-N-acetylmuramyl pentapeptide phosphotransferase/UDP-N-acetylglucosamine-1-phosphate transferase